MLDKVAMKFDSMSLINLMKFGIQLKAPHLDLVSTLTGQPSYDLFQTLFDNTLSSYLKMKTTFFSFIMLS